MIRGTILSLAMVMLGGFSSALLSMEQGSAQQNSLDRLKANPHGEITVLIDGDGQEDYMEDGSKLFFVEYAKSEVLSNQAISTDDTRLQKAMHKVLKKNKRIVQLEKYERVMRRFPYRKAEIDKSNIIPKGMKRYRKKKHTLCPLKVCQLFVEREKIISTNEQH